MIPDCLQYFLDDIWNDQKCDQIWTLGPRIYHQNILKHTGKKGTTLKHVIFIFENLKFWKAWKVCVPIAYPLSCEFLKFEFEIRNLTIWKLVFFEIWNIENWQFEIRKMKTPKLDICKLNISSVRFSSDGGLLRRLSNLHFGDVRFWKHLEYVDTLQIYQTKSLEYRTLKLMFCECIFYCVFGVLEMGAFAVNVFLCLNDFSQIFAGSTHISLALLLVRNRTCELLWGCTSSILFGPAT